MLDTIRQFEKIPIIALGFPDRKGFRKQTPWLSEMSNFKVVISTE